MQVFKELTFTMMASDLAFRRFLRVAALLPDSRPTLTIAGGISAIPRLVCRVGIVFDLLNVMGGAASGVFNTDAPAFVSSRVCIMHTR